MLTANDRAARSRPASQQLTPQQQQLLLDNLGRVYKVAHRVWQSANLPARWCEELRAEAVLEACRCACRYVPGKWSFADVAAFQVRKHLWRWLQRRPAAELLGDRDNDIYEDTDETTGAKLALVLQLLPALPERQRQVLETHYGLDGGGMLLSFPEVSQRLSTALSTVKGAEKRALDNLRQILKDDPDLTTLNLDTLRKRFSRGGDRKSKEWQAIHAS